jgi:hypothetical protein
LLLLGIHQLAITPKQKHGFRARMAKQTYA